MKNKLDDFIIQNRQGLDDLEPSPELWNKIASKLDEKPAKKSFQMRIWMSAAASIVVIFGLWMYSGITNNKTIEIADINPAYAEKQIRFSSLIEEKRDSLASFESVDPELTKEFSSDLVKLDEAYDKLQQEILTSPNKEVIVKAMIRNREMQLQTLRQQLYILNQVNDLKTKKDLAL